MAKKGSKGMVWRKDIADKLECDIRTLHGEVERLCAAGALPFSFVLWRAKRKVPVKWQTLIIQNLT